MQLFSEADFFEFSNLFIGCFSSLERLFVTTRESGRIAVDKICRQGQTLRFFHFDPLYHTESPALSETRNDYTATEPKARIAGCLRIKELGVHAATLNQPAFGAPFSVPGGKTFAKALDVLARFSSLRSLRFNHLLTAAENHHQDIPSAVNAVQYNQLASDIMQYLFQQGSPIKNYYTSPTIIPNVSEGKAAIHRHIWLHYYYMRVTLIISLCSKTYTRVLALPAKENITEYVRYPAFLS